LEIQFTKYQGAGNDFIIIDGFEYPDLYNRLTTRDIKRMCNRHFGIGADGLMILQPQKEYDFEMIYYNSDGNTSSMCGNGGRCIIDFAFRRDIPNASSTRFLASDGPHVGQKAGSNIAILMSDVKEVEQLSDSDYFLDTGSPHYVRVVPDLETIDIIRLAHAVRYNERFKQEGTNVNFIKLEEDLLSIRTYERGVEGETLACGTGVVAASIVSSLITGKSGEIKVAAQGGMLSVVFTKANGLYKDIWLTGQAQAVFSGSIDPFLAQD